MSDSAVFPAYKAVLFDLDNTLLDRTLTFERFTRSFIEAYLPFTEPTAKEEIFHRIIELDQDGYKDKRVLFNELREELPWSAPPPTEELMDFYNAEYVNSAVLMEEADEVVDRIRSKYRTGLITNGRTFIQYGKIDRLGLRERFDVILVSEEAGIKKPDPGLFRMALDRLGLEAKECLFVGDHPVNDVQGAAAVGMETIWMQVNQPWREGLSARPKHVIRRISELSDLL